MSPSTIFVVFQTPSTWPPDASLIILKKQLEDGVLSVTFNHSNNPLVIFARHNGFIDSFEFREVTLKPSSNVHMTVILEDETISLRINGNGIPIQKSTIQVPDSTLNLKKEPQQNDRLFYPNLNTSLYSTQEEHIFLESIRDIDNRISYRDRYNIIKAAGILRLILTDGLLDKVNRRFKYKVVFRIIDNSIEPPISPDLHWVQVSPESIPSVKTIEVNKDNFLSTTVFKSPNINATVKDVILYCSNVLGGVHFGDPQKKGQEMLLEIDNSLRTLSGEMSIYSVYGILEVSLIAFKPIVTQITGTSNH